MRQRKILPLEGGGSVAASRVRGHLRAEEGLIRLLNTLTGLVEAGQVAVVPTLNHLLLLLFSRICDIGTATGLRVHRRSVDAYFTLIGMTAGYA